MTAVFDASVLIAALTHKGADGTWARARVAESSLKCPELALAEATNILRRMELTGEVTTAEDNQALVELFEFAIELFPFEPYAERVWAPRHNVTGYDAWYVALAESLRCPLITLDRRLSRSSGPSCNFVIPAESDETGRA